MISSVADVFGVLFASEIAVCDATLVFLFFVRVERRRCVRSVCCFYEISLKEKMVFRYIVRLVILKRVLNRWFFLKIRICYMK